MTGVSRRVRFAELLLPLAVSAALLLSLDPSLWLRDTIPALTDLPGHFLPPVLLREGLLQNGSFGGWRHEWFAGFPLYHFYFPLPGLLIAALSPMFGAALALRIVALAPIVLMPWSLWTFARLSGLPLGQRVGVTVGGTGSVLMLSHWLWGGNILAMVAGEFSYGWSLLLLMPYLGLLARPPGERRCGPVAGMVLTGAILSHIVPVVAAFVAMLPFLLVRRTRRRLVISGAVAGALSGFWLIPMAVHLPYVGGKVWTDVPGLAAVVPLELALVLPGAALGLRLVRRHLGLGLLLSMGVAGLFLAILPQSLAHRGRTFPLWYLTVHVLAGTGIAHALAPREPRGSRSLRLAPMVGLVATGCWLFVIQARGIDSDNWRETAMGLPARPGAEELDSLVEVLEGLPAGRIHWEDGELLQHWGGKFAFSLLPYWTEHSVLEGLLAESSPLVRSIDMINVELSARPTEPAAPMDVPDLDWSPMRAVSRLRLLGVRYLLTHSPETSDAVAAAVGAPRAVIGGLHLFELGAAPLVTPVPCLQVAEGGPYRKAMEEWFLAWRPGAPLLVEEPHSAAGWTLESGCREDERGPGLIGGSPGSTNVEVVRMTDTQISFETSEPGVPHLVRVSAFPNWRTRGAAGPYRAGPSLMLVVPEGRTVVLEYRAGWPERTGWTLTVLATLFLLIDALNRRRCMSDSNA